MRVPKPSPTALRRFWAVLIAAHVALWIVATLCGWVHSVAFVSHLSIEALVLACAASWQGARAEVKADPDEPTP